MNRTDALPYVSFYVDDALSGGSIAPADVPDDARLVGWQAGFEPLFVAVYSYLPGCMVDADEAEELARDYLAERGWFEDPTRPADYVI